MFIPSLIKSVQRIVSGAGNTTITAVDINNTIILFDGCETSCATGFVDGQGMMRCFLANSTTVTVTSDGNSGGTLLATVIEFYPGFIKSLQYGTVTVANGFSSANQTLATTLASITKATAFYLGATNVFNSSAFGFGIFMQDVAYYLQLLNTTTISAGRLGSQYDGVVGYCLVEWK